MRLGSSAARAAGLHEAILRLPDGAYHTYMLLAEGEQAALLGS